MARVLIGTSGWHYGSWRGPFYPARLPIKAQLQYYASQFETTELNGVFYRTPSADAVKRWKEQTGEDFTFTWKASKFITHWKGLSANSVNSLELMEDRLSLLGDRRYPLRHEFHISPAQSVGEKTGVNSTLGISPTTSDFVKEAAMSDMTEIATAKLGQERGNTQEKTFATHMITDTQRPPRN